MRAFSLIILAMLQTIDSQDGTLIGDEVWHDDFNYASTVDENDNGWLLERWRGELNETKFKWVPDGHQYRNITFWGLFTNIDSYHMSLSRNFRCPSLAKWVSLKYKTATCGYSETQDTFAYWMPENNDPDFNFDGILQDQRDGVVNGTAIEGYTMSSSLFGQIEKTPGQNITLNTICQQNSDGSAQHYWVQEWGVVYDQGIAGNTDFLIWIQLDLLQDLDTEIMIFDLSLECNVIPTTSPTPEPTGSPTFPTLSPTTAIPSSNPTTYEPTYPPSTEPTTAPTKIHKPRTCDKISAKLDHLSAVFYNISAEFDQIWEELNE